MHAFQMTGTYIYIKLIIYINTTIYELRRDLETKYSPLLDYSLPRGSVNSLMMDRLLGRNM